VLKYFLFFVILIFSVMNPAFAKTVAYPVYFGVQGGYGNTDWARLVSQDDLSATATPSTATGDGFAYGLLTGYQLTPQIAFEANYLKFPDSDLTFITPNIYGISSMTSETKYYSVIAKLFVLTNSDFRIFGDIGWGYVRRSDEMVGVISNSGLTVGLGADYSISEHWLGLFSFEDTPGTGVAAEDASALYVPYLYSLTLGLAYRF